MDTGVSFWFLIACRCLLPCTVSYRWGHLTEMLSLFAAGQEGCCRQDSESYILSSFPETPLKRCSNGGSPSTSS